MPIKPHFFIVTPSYNQAQFIGQTIDSVQAQTAVQVTQIVADGGSTDQTVSLLKPRSELIWWSKKDRGQSHAINLGIENVERLIKKNNLTHTFFAFLNSDDYYLHSNVLATVATAFQKHPESGWLVGDALIVDENNQEIQHSIRWYKQLMRRIPGILHIMNPFPQPAVFFRWSTIEKVGMFNEKLQYTMDYEYWLRTEKAVGRPLLLTQPVAAFRIHSSSKGKQSFEQQFAEELEVAKKYSPGWLTGLHQLHNQLITTVYSFIK